MPDIQEVLTACKSLESLLVKRFHAQGRGLHEKIDNVKTKLSPLQIRGLRIVATVRNKIAHEDRFTDEHVPEDYIAICNELSGQLDGSVHLAVKDSGTHTQLAQCYCECLRQKGINPETDERGNIAFQYEGETYRLDIQREDPGFLRLLRPDFHRVRRIYGARLIALEAANVHAAKYKAAKFTFRKKAASVFP